MNAYSYTQDNAKKSYYPLLKYSAICEAPSKPPIQESNLSQGDRKENITNKRNIFTVKLIKCSIQEVAAKLFTMLNILAVDVTRSPQYCQARLSKQQELTSMSTQALSQPTNQQIILCQRKPS